MHVIAIHQWLNMHNHQTRCSVLEKVFVSVSLGSYNKVPKTGWLKQQKFISHGSEGWEVQDQGSDRSSVWWGPSSCCILTCQEEREEPLLSLIRSLIPFIDLHPHDLIISQRPLLLPPSYLELGFQHIHFGEMITLVHSSV